MFAEEGAELFGTRVAGNEPCQIEEARSVAPGEDHSPSVISVIGATARGGDSFTRHGVILLAYIRVSVTGVS